MTLDRLMAETTVDGFRSSLASLFFSALIVQPYQGLASKAMLEKARSQIEAVVCKTINGHSYRDVRDIYLYIHLIQAREQFSRALAEVVAATADENPVDAGQTAEFLATFYRRLYTDFESHHASNSSRKRTA